MSIYQDQFGPRPDPDPAVFQRLFKLTPTEAKVAWHVARGDGPDKIAVSTHRSKDTVRHQLKTVFVKTDTHTQSRLAVLLLQASGAH